MDDPSRKEVDAKGYFPDSTNVSDDPPRKFTSEVAPKSSAEDDLSNEIMFKADNTYVGFILVPTTFNLLQKPSSLKPCFDFGLSSTSEEAE